MPHERRDALASILGVLVFLAGVGIVIWTFMQAFQIYSTAPKLNLGVESGKPIDFTVVGRNFVQLLIKILVLVVMAGIGSALANRGARMYASGKSIRVHTDSPGPSE